MAQYFFSKSCIFCDATAQIGPRPPHFGFRYHTQLDTHTRRRGLYLHSTQQTQEMNIHALSGIRIRNPSKSRGFKPMR